MSTRTLQLSEALHAYLIDQTLREADVLRRLRLETAGMPRGNMQISPEQGQFMQLLVEMLGARRTLEVGVFTGYSSLAVAQALPEDGRIIACDVSADWTDVARRYWAEAGVAHKIDLRLRPAGETLIELVETGHAGKFDFAFIDADKTGYDAYYEQTLTLLRPGGVLGLDNALRDGEVADAGATNPDTIAVRKLNAKVRSDPRVTMSLVPIGDGLLLARKR